MADYMNVPYLARRYGGKEPPRLGLAHPSIAPYGAFSAADGVILISIQNEREWVAFCARVLGRAELSSDPRFVRNTERVRNRAVLDGLVQDIIGRFRIAELCALLDEARIAYGRLSTAADLATHRSATRLPLETPEGVVEVLAPPAIVDGARPALGRICARGEHDAALRAEFLGRGGAPAGRRA
jgi:crotonobetainyl-CoA:carnitine CoA-transferase CaiB-like acyl-CoA transferase